MHQLGPFLNVLRAITHITAVRDVLLEVDIQNEGLFTALKMISQLQDQSRDSTILNTKTIRSVNHHLLMQDYRVLNLFH